jgi:hypothetical protein
MKNNEKTNELIDKIRNENGERERIEHDKFIKDIEMENTKNNISPQIIEHYKKKHNPNLSDKSILEKIFNDRYGKNYPNKK